MHGISWGLFWLKFKCSLVVRCVLPFKYTSGDSHGGTKGSWYTSRSQFPRVVSWLWTVVRSVNVMSGLARLDLYSWKTAAVQVTFDRFDSFLSCLGGLWHKQAPEWFSAEEETSGPAEASGAGEAARGAETQGERGWGETQGGREVRKPLRSLVVFFF